jgi:hypothetical protein
MDLGISCLVAQCLGAEKGAGERDGSGGGWGCCWAPFIGWSVTSRVVEEERQRRLVVDSIKTFGFAKGWRWGVTILGRGME